MHVTAEATLATPGVQLLQREEEEDQELEEEEEGGSLDTTATGAVKTNVGNKKKKKNIGVRRGLGSGEVPPWGGRGERCHLEVGFWVFIGRIGCWCGLGKEFLGEKLSSERGAGEKQQLRGRAGKEPRWFFAFSPGKPCR